MSEEVEGGALGEESDEGEHPGYEAGLCAGRGFAFLPRGVAAAADSAAGPVYGTIHSFYAALRNYYRVPEMEIARFRDSGISYEELPVVFFIAEGAHTEIQRVIELRSRTGVDGNRLRRPDTRRLLRASRSAPAPAVQPAVQPLQQQAEERMENGLAHRQGRGQSREPQVPGGKLRYTVRTGRQDEVGRARLFRRLTRASAIAGKAGCPLGEAESVPAGFRPSTAARLFYVLLQHENVTFFPTFFPDIL